MDTRPDPFRRDGDGFALFTCYLVLAFTTAIPNHFTLPKLLGLHLFVVFSAVRWLGHARREEIRSPGRGLLLVVGTLVVWSLVATANAQHVETAMFGVYGRYNGLFTLLAGVALFVTTGTQRLPDREVSVRLAWVAIALALASAYAVLQALGIDPIPWPEGRPASTMGHPVVFAGTLAMVLPFMLVLTVRAPTWLPRIGWTVSTLFALLAFAVTLARGPWLGAAVGIATLLLLAMTDRRALPRPLAGVVVLLFLLAAAGASLHQPVRARLVSRLASLVSFTSDSSVVSRVLFYRAALAMVRDHPVVGVGFENFPLLYPRYRAAEADRIAPDVIPTMVHNNPLQSAVSAGVPAVLLFTALAYGVGASIVRRWRRERDPHQRLVGAAFIGGLLAFLVQGLSGWPDVALSTLAWMLAGLAVAWGLGVTGESGPRPGRRTILAATIVMCALGSALAYDTWRRIRADRLVLVAQYADPRQSWPDTRETLREAVRISPDKGWASDAAAVLHLQRVLVAADRQAYEEGVEWTRRASAANPFDPYSRLRRAELETAALERGLIGRVGDEAERALAIARGLDPNNGTVYEREARLELAAGHPGEAVAAIRSALRIRPGWPRYRVLNGDIMYAQGKSDEAEAEYRAAIATAAPGSPDARLARRRLAALLNENGRYTEAEAVARTLLAGFPSDVVGWVLLGEAMAALDRTGEAREAFSRALALDPSSRAARDGLARTARAAPAPR